MASLLTSGVAWSAVHCLIGWQVEGMAWGRRRYFCRLVRSLLYAVLASAAGGYLLLTSYGSVRDLLFRRSPLAQVCFGVAGGHWAVSIFEEIFARSHALSFGIDASGTSSRRLNRWRSILVALYIAHHVAAVCAYAVAGLSGELESLGALGLWYELPVILVTARDFFKEFGRDTTLLRWLPSTCRAWFAHRRFPERPPLPGDVSDFWQVVLWLFWIGRGPATALYVLSWSRPSWRREVLTLKFNTAYHVFGITFTVLSLGWRAILALSLAADHRRSFSFAKGGWKAVDDDLDILQQALFGQTEATETSTAGKKTTTAETNDDYHDLESAAALLKKHQGRLISAEELAACGETWLAVDGRVIDVSRFEEKHPGGGAVLRRYLGRDATQAFTAAGHSKRATDMLARASPSDGLEFVGTLMTKKKSTRRQSKVVNGEERTTKDPPDNKKKKGSVPRDQLWSVDRSVAYSYLSAHWDVVPPMGAAAWTHLFAALALFKILPRVATASIEATFRSRDQFTLADVAIVLLVLLASPPGRDGKKNSSNEYDGCEDNTTATKKHEGHRRRMLVSVGGGVVAGSADAALALALACVSVVDGTVAAASAVSLAIDALWSGGFESKGGLGKCARLFWAAALVTAAKTMTPRISVALIIAASLVAQGRATRCGRDDDAALGRSARRVAAPLIAIIGSFFFIATAQARTSDVSLGEEKNRGSSFFGSRAVLSWLWSFCSSQSRYTMVEIATLAFRYGVVCVAWRLRETADAKLRRATSDAFASRTRSFAALAAWASFCPGETFSGRGLLVLIVHAAWLSQRQRDTLEALGPAAPSHLYGTQTVVDRSRLFASFLVRQVASYLVSLANLAGPRGAFWFLSPTPLPIVDNVDYGVALFAKGDLSAQATSYQLNVGQLATFPAVDAVHTARATATMIADLAQPHLAKERGFVANLVAFVPDRDTGTLREINLNAWTSDQKAHDWYRSSDAHKTIVERYYDRQMSTFSSVLASLAPNKPVRYHAGCHRCFEIQRHYPDQTSCPNCHRDVTMTTF